MEYSILKDNTPENTIKNIDSIIKKLGIEITEKLFIETNSKYAPYSVNLTIKGTKIGTNGKGTSLINAKASARAEFIERLQNMRLINLNNEIIQQIPDKEISYKKNEILTSHITKIKKYENLKETEQLIDIAYLPYYSLKEKQIKKLPINVILTQKGTNGMAAGNTYEEALVQGLSEVCERYVAKQTLKKKLRLPDIPEEHYLKYDNIKNIIHYFKENNYNVYVKDASANTGLPVICTIFENKKNNMIDIKFGAHPSLPIAIERTLTEATQGISLNEYSKNPYRLPFYSKSKYNYSKRLDIFQSLISCKIGIIKNRTLDKQFFSKEYDYEFNINNWIEENKDYNNKQLLEFITNKILKLTTDIYIRDVSFLGFPSIDIYVPNISEIFEFNKKSLHKFILDKNWGNLTSKNIRDSKYNINSLLELAEIFTFWMKTPCLCKKTFTVPFEYIALLCAIVLKIPQKVIKYGEIILDQNEYEQVYDYEQVKAIEIIKYYFKNYKLSQNEIKEKLQKKYNEKDIEETIELITKLTYEDILGIIINKKKETKEKVSKSILNRILREYRKNIPNQMKFKEIFANCNLKQN